MSAGNNLIENISAKQNEYISLIAEIMEIRKRGEKPLAYIRTYGCQQNVADSEKIKGMLANAGFGFVDAPDDADFILFNTCAVREHAEDRVFGNVGALKALKRRHPQIFDCTLRLYDGAGTHCEQNLQELSFCRSCVRHTFSSSFSRTCI